ncbi:MAG: sigma-70 family RNA polymerase sigma factor [Clostridia bacterium]|nr:sigma-70 family RNA polymerase sigma factor [Clostridia bacterium]
MEDKREEEYIVIPERETEHRIGRKTEVRGGFGRSEELCVREVEAYLTDYRTSARMIEMNRYERDYLGIRIKREGADLSRETEVYLKAKMYDVRAFVLSIPDCDEKLLLYYHYIHGQNMSRCAELLDISRATVYRLKQRALRTAAVLYREKLGRAL